MRRIITGIAITTLSLSAAAQAPSLLPGMTAFANNTPADADAMNNNLEVISQQSLTNEARIERLEQTSDRLFRLEALEGVSLRNSATARLEDGVTAEHGGPNDLDLNGTANQSALVDAYQTYGRYAQLELTLSGNCRGYFWLNRDLTSGFRERGQRIAISSAAGTTASIIPRVIHTPSGATAVGLWALDGSSLELSGVNVQLGSFDVRGVLIDRNSSGYLTDVSITTPTGSSPGADLNGFALLVDNNSFLQVSGDLTINADAISAVAIQNGSVASMTAGLVAVQNSAGSGIDLRRATLDAETALSLLVPDDVNSYALFADGATVQVSAANGGSLKTQGRVRFDNSVATIGEYIPNLDVPLEPNRVLSINDSKVEITTYDEAILPGNRISCGGLNVVGFVGRDPQDLNQIITRDNTTIDGLDPICVSRAQWRSIIQNALLLQPN